MQPAWHKNLEYLQTRRSSARMPTSFVPCTACRQSGTRSARHGHALMRRPSGCLSFGAVRLTPPGLLHRVKRFPARQVERPNSGDRLSQNRGPTAWPGAFERGADDPAVQHHHVALHSVSIGRRLSTESQGGVVPSGRDWHSCSTIALLRTVRAMRRTLSAATLSLLSALTAGACSGEEPVASPPAASTPTSSSNTATQSEPTAEPTQPTKSVSTINPTQPVLPEAAKKHSQAGARTFIEHYISVLNAAYQQTEPRWLARYTPVGCSLCASFLQVLERIHREGGSQIGGAWAPSRIDLAARESSDRWIFIATIDIAEGHSRGSKGAQAQPIVPDEIRVQIRLDWRNDRWTLNNVVPI